MPDIWLCKDPFFCANVPVSRIILNVQVQILRHQNPKCDYYFYFIHQMLARQMKQKEILFEMKWREEKVRTKDGKSHATEQ